MTIYRNDAKGYILTVSIALDDTPAYVGKLIAPNGKRLWEARGETKSVTIARGEEALEAHASR